MCKNKISNLFVLFSVILLLSNGCSFNTVSQSGSVLTNSSASEETKDILYQEDPVDILHSEETEVEFDYNSGFDIQTNLDSWIGDYLYLDRVPSEEAMESYNAHPIGHPPSPGIYELYIYKSRNIRELCFAEFSVFGWMISLDCLTIVQGNDEEISIVFYDYLPYGRGVGWEFKKGDILFTLRKTEAGIIPNWNECFDYLDPNNDEAFVRIDENDNT